MNRSRGMCCELYRSSAAASFVCSYDIPAETNASQLLCQFKMNRASVWL